MDCGSNFDTSRIYGGWADGQMVTQLGTTYYIGCTSPEPYAYEEGFGVQRLIVAQINGVPDSNGYSGNVIQPTPPGSTGGRTSRREMTS